MNRGFFLLIAALVVSVAVFASTGSNTSKGVDKLTGNNVKKSYSVEPGRAFQVIITGEAAEGQISKGEINLYASGGVEYGFPFALEKGKSGKWGGDPSDNVTEITITLKQGTILIKFKYKSK